jgi:hypothetical protein
MPNSNRNVAKQKAMATAPQTANADTDIFSIFYLLPSGTMPGGSA